MSLHAAVFCNCFETGNLKRRPPDPQGISVLPDGNLSYTNEIFEKVLEFDRWRKNACEHADGVLFSCSIGNIALVALLRRELEQQVEKFPLLLEKVVYDGVHAGDFLTVGETLILDDELEILKEFQASDDYSQKFIDEFHEQMLELVKAALLVGKPILF